MEADWLAESKETKALLFINPNFLLVFVIIGETMPQKGIDELVGEERIF